MNKYFNIDDADHESDWKDLTIMRLLSDVSDLEERIDKAIEYIEKNKQISMFADLRKEGTHQYDLECDADDLLEILGDKENEWRK